MRLEQLHYFVTICDKRSINLASKELFITQQSLSSSINHLEREVGDKLLIRTNRGVYPTELGKRVYQFAQRTLRDWNDILDQSTNHIYSEVHGTLNSLCSYSFYKTFMPKYSVHILEHFPNLSGSGSAANFDTILTSLHRRSIDLAFVTLACDDSSTNIVPNENLVFTPLFSCELYALVNSHSSLAQKAYLTTDELLNEDIVLIQESDMHLYRTIFQNRYKDFLQNIRLFHLSEIISEYIKQEGKITLDLKMGPYGLTYQSFLQDHNITHIPISFSDSGLQLYGGILTYKNNDKIPLIETILNTFS